jgi:DNA-binding protein H-NS
MQWRQQDIHVTSFSSNDSSTTTITKTKIQKLHSVSEQRQMIEKEIIRREKKIRQELESSRNEKTVELVIKEYQKHKKNDLIFMVLGVLLGVIICQCKGVFFQS